MKRKFRNILIWTIISPLVTYLAFQILWRTPAFKTKLEDEIQTLFCKSECEVEIVNLKPYGWIGFQVENMRLNANSQNFEAKKEKIELISIPKFAFDVGLQFAPRFRMKIIIDAEFQDSTTLHLIYLTTPWLERKAIKNGAFGGDVYLAYHNVPLKFFWGFLFQTKNPFLLRLNGNISGDARYVFNSKGEREGTLKLESKDLILTNLKFRSGDKVLNHGSFQPFSIQATLQGLSMILQKPEVFETDLGRITLGGRMGFDKDGPRLELFKQRFLNPLNKETLAFLNFETSFKEANKLQTLFVKAFECPQALSLKLYGLADELECKESKR